MNPLFLQAIEVALLIFLSTVCAYGAEPQFAVPLGWRLPTRSELGDPWRQRGPYKYAIAKGNFDADGIADQAYLLVSRKDGQVGLFALLSSQSRGEPILLNRERNPAYIQVVGVSVVDAGKYRTACGKGYWDCAKGEPEEIQLDSDAIAYFKHEGASSLFYWDKLSKSLKRVWISD